MKPKIILHIGINKTGTTSLQHFFSQNRQALIKNGLLYPATGIHDHAHHHFSRILGFDPRRKLLGVIDEPSLAEMRNNLFTEVVKSNAGKVLISSEYLMIPGKVRRVRNFFDDFEVKVIVYLRRHDFWLESAYTEAIKNRKTLPWDGGIEKFLEFTKHRRPRRDQFRKLVDRWSRWFGKENIIVRPYEIQQNKPNLLADFIHAAKLETFMENITLNTGWYNQSPSAGGIKILESIQQKKSSRLTWKIMSFIAKCFPSNESQKSLMTDEQRLKLINENMDDYKYIAREYLGRDDGWLFLDPLPDTKTSNS